MGSLSEFFGHRVLGDKDPFAFGGRVCALISPHDHVSALQGNVTVCNFNPLCFPQLPLIWPKCGDQVSGTQGYSQGAEWPLPFAWDGCFLGLWLRTMSQHEVRKNAQDMRPGTNEPPRHGIYEVNDWSLWPWLTVLPGQ